MSMHAEDLRPGRAPKANGVGPRAIGHAHASRARPGETHFGWFLQGLGENHIHPTPSFFHGTRTVLFFAGYWHVKRQDGTSRSESPGLRRLGVVRSAHSHCSIPSRQCRALG